MHRVWVVEATLKPDAHHIYQKRVFFFDEDSFEILHVDEYDGRGELWRVHETFPIEYYDWPGQFWVGEAIYDLQASRYLVFNMLNEEKSFLHGTKMDIEMFQPDAMRRLGTQ